MSRVHLLVVLPAAALFAVSLVGAGIAPANAEINIGPVPIDLYSRPNNGALGACPNPTWTVQQCIKSFFKNNPSEPDGTYNPKNYIRQGVTGVRFQLRFKATDTALPGTRTGITSQPATRSC